MARWGIRSGRSTAHHGQATPPLAQARSPRCVCARSPTSTNPHSRDPTPPSGAAAGAAEAERSGVAEGTDQGRSREPSDEDAVATEAANAAASNYPGAVMRKINRTRKPNVGARGTAVLGFEIASNGALASNQVLRSSGSATIDAAAVDHLQRGTFCGTPCRCPKAVSGCVREPGIDLFKPFHQMSSPPTSRPASLYAPRHAHRCCHQRHRACFTPALAPPCGMRCRGTGKPLVGLNVII
jgi:TonB family protein